MNFDQLTGVDAMKRLIDYFLREWRSNPLRQPLILKGARQVGKTYAARKLGTLFSEFVEINFEQFPAAREIFKQDLNPKRIIQELSLFTKKEINPGTTLLFLDEIQETPNALLALRYFYEEMPNLHVIAAGSLLDFTIQEIGEPVGRVESLHMYPLSFIEFLAALKEYPLIKEILGHEPTKELSTPIHEKCMRHVAHYLALGGMPAVVEIWHSTEKPQDCARIQKKLLSSYKQDFTKYAKERQIPYVTALFNEIPYQLGKKFKYSKIEGDYRKRELQPALNLLQTAGILHKVLSSSGQGLPIGAQVNTNNFKTIFLDVGLTQSILGLDLSNWFLQPFTEFVNKGNLVEAFVGQELLTYSEPLEKANLYYWQRNVPSSTAEVDYLIQQKECIIPIEVKSGAGTTLKSLHSFLKTHPHSPYGIRLSAQNYSMMNSLHSYPLYAIAKIISNGNEDIKKSIEALLA